MQPRMEIALKFIRYHKKTSWANAHSTFLTFKCLGITLLVHKYNFMPVKLCHLWHFVADRAKKWEEIMCYCDRLFAKKKWQKILFESGSLLSWVSFYIWMIYRSKKIIIKIQKSASLGEEYIEGSGSGRCGLRLLHSTVGQSGLKPLPTTPRVI